MMESKHTPGPWKYRHVAETDEHLILQNGSAAYTLVDTFGGNVNKADAALIAAAPELLHMLRVLTWRTEGFLADSDQPDDEQLLADIDALIAKAEGR